MSDPKPPSSANSGSNTSAADAAPSAATAETAGASQAAASAPAIAATNLSPSPSQNTTNGNDSAPNSGPLGLPHTALRLFAYAYNLGAIEVYAWDGMANVKTPRTQAELDAGIWVLARLPYCPLDTQGALIPIEPEPAP